MIKHFIKKQTKDDERLMIAINTLFSPGSWPNGRKSVDLTGKYDSNSLLLMDVNRHFTNNLTFNYNHNVPKRKFLIKDLRDQMSEMVTEQDTLSLLLGGKREEEEDYDDALNPHPFKFLINEGLNHA
uniref:Uncharacterized protein n=1 Tax=Romanomermis culicivorax TaxID=13658 RepID=A0A915KX74_ROMCU